MGTLFGSHQKFFVDTVVVTPKVTLSSDLKLNG